MEGYSLESILLTPSTELSEELNDIVSDINIKTDTDTIESLRKKANVKVLIEKYKEISNKILLLKIYNFYDKIKKDDKVIVKDSILDSFLINSYVHDNMKITDISRKLNDIKQDAVHQSCQNNEFRNFRPIDPFTDKEIEVVEELNGKCYELSDIYNKLILHSSGLPYDNLTNTIVHKEALNKMYLALTPEQKTIVDNLNSFKGIKIINQYFSSLFLFLHSIMISTLHLDSMRNNEFIDNTEQNRYELTIYLCIIILFITNIGNIFLREINNPNVVTQIKDYVQGRRPLYIETYEKI